MKNYKLGNQVTVIIRSYSDDTFIGSQYIEHANQPYTIIKSAEANLSFKNITSTAKTTFNQLAYTHIKPSQLSISNVTINDKILNLIFHKNQTAAPHLFTKLENVTSSQDKKIYFGQLNQTLKNVFIYDSEGKYKYEPELNNNSYPVDKSGQPYLVCYQYESTTSFSLDQNNNHYYTIDLLLTSNQKESGENDNTIKNDNTINSTIHLEKCALEINSDMSFAQNSNAVDLKFIVLDNDLENYITLE